MMPRLRRRRSRLFEGCSGGLTTADVACTQLRRLYSAAKGALGSAINPFRPRDSLRRSLGEGESVVRVIGNGAERVQAEA